jgi:putative FmdB family regulatory protein
MPIYEYRCKQCGATSEFLVGVSSTEKTLRCKQCGSPKLEKMISVSHSLKVEKRTPGHTCCGREERCSTPPCSTSGGCRRD